MGGEGEITQRKNPALLLFHLQTEIESGGERQKSFEEMDR